MRRCQPLKKDIDMPRSPRRAVRPPVRRLRSWAALCAVALAGCGGGTDGEARYTVSGTLSGLGAGSSVVLQLNAGNDLGLAANGRFTFGARLAAGSSYAVTVKTPPAGQACGVSMGSGKADADVDNVVVRCGAAPASGVPALAGDWAMNRCTAVGNGSSARTVIRVTQTGSATFDWGNGLLLYASADCTGAATAGPVARIGTVLVTDVQTAPGVAAHWGRATLVTGALAYGVWAKRSATELCLVGDESPTLFASADAVLRAIEVAPDGLCYALRPQG